MTTINQRMLALIEGLSTGVSQAAKLNQQLLGLIQGLSTRSQIPDNNNQQLLGLIEGLFYRSISSGQTQSATAGTYRGVHQGAFRDQAPTDHCSKRAPCNFTRTTSRLFPAILNAWIFRMELSSNIWLM